MRFAPEGRFHDRIAARERGEGLAVGFAGSEIDARHGGTLLPEQQGGSGPSG